MRITSCIAMTAVFVLIVGACADDDDTAVPSAVSVAEALLSPDDLPGTWTVAAGPDGSSIPQSGVVTDEMADLLPQAELCDRATAESVAALDAVRWLAFRQLDGTVDDPLDPPADLSGHLAFVQEFLTAGEPDDVERTFDLIAAGMSACLGALPAGEEGPGTAAEFTLPEVGDQRYGVLTTIEEAGGGAEWLLHTAVVRQGAILASVVVVDIRSVDTEPLFTDADIAAIVTAAVDRI